MLSFLQPHQLVRVCLKCQKELLRHRKAPLSQLILGRSLQKDLRRLNSSGGVVNDQENESINNELNHDESTLSDETNSSEVQYVVSHEDFKWVRRLLPPSVIPEPPKHEKYPTPSGWSPPSDTVPDLPYFIPRNRYHHLPVYVRVKHAKQYMTYVKKVEGDIWALEKDLIELVRPHLDFDPATRVHEVTRVVYVKGNFEDLVKEFLLEKGF